MLRIRNAFAYTIFASLLGLKSTYGLASASEGVGFYFSVLKDYSRTPFGGLKNPSPRPIILNCWFKSSSQIKNSLDYLSEDFLQGRSEYFLSNYFSFLREIYKYETKSSTDKNFSSKKTLVSDDLPNRRFQGLVIYHAGLRGSPLDNYILMEQIALKGFLACSASFFPKNYLAFGIDGDLANSLADFDFVVNWLTTQGIKFDKVFTIGHSYGAQAAIHIAHNRTIVEKAISLDSTLDYPSNKEIFDGTQIYETVSDFSSKASLLVTATTGSSPFIWKDRKNPRITWLKIDHLEHGDFTSYGFELANKSGAKKQAAAYLDILQAVTGFIEGKDFSQALSNKAEIKNFGEDRTSISASALARALVFDKKNLDKICTSLTYCEDQALIDMLSILRQSLSPKLSVRGIKYIFDRNDRPLLLYSLGGYLED